MNEIFVRGNIYLANLNPSRGAEVGKVRPVLVIQSNKLNEINYSTVNILPLTTALMNDEFLRLRVVKRNKLSHDSDVLCTQFRALDIGKFTSSAIATLNADEMQQIEQKIEWILGFND
ncbi:MAG: Endoribonuclease MazF [Catillopecten margaritatus gill symbiont]|uniref:mRNA interferase n=1 Tax=Catillopecten margaritatus gill symbiont TaxID=3083288 RepID=A0AAU6PGZ0_9GAMM